MNESLIIEMKLNLNDLVINIDKEMEMFFIECI